MSGTKKGGLKAAKTNKERYGDDFYANIGAKGGAAGNTGGFAKRTACDCSTIDGLHHKGQCAGKRGGFKSRRGPSKRIEVKAVEAPKSRMSKVFSKVFY